MFVKSNFIDTVAGHKNPSAFGRKLLKEKKIRKRLTKYRRLFKNGFDPYHLIAFNNHNGAV